MKRPNRGREKGQWVSSQPNNLQSSPLNSFSQLQVCVAWSSFQQNNLCQEVASVGESNQTQVRILRVDKFVIKQILEGI